MAVTVLSSIAEGHVGALVRFTAQTNHNPPVWNGFYDSGTDKDRVRMTHVTALSGLETYKLTNINQEPHKIRFASVLGVNGGFLEYTLHPTNQLTDCDTTPATPVANLGTKELAIELYSVANPTILPLQVRIKSHSIEVWTHAGLVHTHAIASGVPSGTKITMIVTPPFLIVWVAGVEIWRGVVSGSYPLPMGLQYSARGIATSTVMGYAGSHPAVATGLQVPAFNAAALFGDWRDNFDKDDIGFGGLGRSVSVYNGATLLGSATIINEGKDAANHYWFETIIPNTATATKIRGLFSGHISDGVYSYKDVDIVAGSNLPLAIQPATPVPIEPGATVRFVSPNYTPAELTFTADGAGSFPATKGQFGTGGDSDLFTAPTDAGTYTVTITGGGGQSSVITIVVPVRLAPATASMVGGATQGFTVNANVTTPSSQWTADGGSLSSKATRTATYTAPASTGNYKVFAQTVLGLAEANIAVTSSGSIPTTQLRLTENQIAVNAPANVDIHMRGDVSPAIWAIVSNVRIDGSNNNLFILQNTAVAEATIAQAHRSAGGILTWNFNSGMALDPSDSARFAWLILNDAFQEVARLEFIYTGSGQVYDIELKVEGSLVGGASAVNMSAYTGGLQIEAIDQTTFTFRYRAASGDAWTVLLASQTVAGARFFRFRYTPTIRSQSNNTVVLADPDLTGTWGRWLRPNWSAELINAQNQVIGSVPYTAFEQVGVVVPGQVEQAATVVCSSVGTVRVRATYPSGATTVNQAVITVSPGAGGDPLEILSPSSPYTMDPLSTVDLSINIAEDLVIFRAPVGGSFGTTLPTRSVYTSPANAGNQYYVTVERGAEIKRLDIIVRSKPSTDAFTVQATKSFVFFINYAGVFSVGATQGTVAKGAVVGGQTALTYTAPGTGGWFPVITITTPFGTSTVNVTVTDVTLPALEISTAPASVEPDATKLIETSYPANEVTFSVPFGAGTINAAGLWTAPHTAGKYIITAYRENAGTPDTVEMTVPLRITPRTPPAIPPGQQIQFQWNYPTLTLLQLSNGGGTITSAGRWTAGQVAGVYTLFARAVIAGVNFDDTINLQVASNSLALNQPAALTLNPGETIAITSLFYTTAEMTFAAVSGSFASNVYTAPADAGPDTITVSKGAIVETIAVTVRLAITPAQTTIPLNTNQLVSVNADVSLFTGAGLTLSSTTTRTVQAKSLVPGTYFLTATTAFGTITARLDVTAAGAPALTITNADPLIVKKSTTVDILINYPVDADASFSATGGSFHPSIKNRWTAPETAGDYTITASRTGLSNDTITARVVYEIEPAAVSVEPGAQVRFRANHPSTSWDEAGAVGLISIDGLLTAGFTPGRYDNSIIATAPGSLVAYATVTVQAAVLVVYLPPSLTMDPLGTQLVGTNVPSASCQFTAHGGSFGGPNGNLYTAPEAAGDYWFEVSYQGQTIRTDVHVALKITPDSVQLSADQVFQFHVNAASPAWSVSGSGNVGSIDPVTGSYTAPSSGGTIVTVVASIPGASDTATVFFLDLFPYQPNFPVEGEVDRIAEVVTSESGRQSSRVRGSNLRSFDLQFLNRQRLEFLAARAFFMARYPTTGFIFEDIEAGEFVGVQPISKFAFRYNSAENQFDYQFTVRELEE